MSQQNIRITSSTSSSPTKSSPPATTAATPSSPSTISAAARNSPSLAAGTGLYLRALLEGLADAPTRSEELRDRLRRSAKQRGPVHLHKILARLDPASAARIAPRDTQKIIRAIEMRILAVKPSPEIFNAGRSDSPDDDRRKVRSNALEGYAITKIGLAPPRPALYARIDARVNECSPPVGSTSPRPRLFWVRDKARENVRNRPDAKPFQFIGYSDLRAHLEGPHPARRRSRQYPTIHAPLRQAQLTWFPPRGRRSLARRLRRRRRNPRRRARPDRRSFVVLKLAVPIP